MRSLSDTIERLARLRAMKPGASGGSHLAKLEQFGSNPGALAAWYHVPMELTVAPALVVVLHGCTQTAAGYDLGSGWSKLAEDYGFAVLFPEQARANNPNLCFNWFNAEDIRRDSGEVLSIRQMIAAMVKEYGIDERRIYVTGLSAGGAMANAAMATYPELFAGGAIIGGLPYATATTVPEAFDRMRGEGLPQASTLVQNLRAASAHQGPWPTVSIWHGAGDTVVVKANATAVAEQWRGVHGLHGQPTSVETFDRYSRTAWRDTTGTETIELYQISGMGHGTPIDAASGYGAAAPFMLDVGISSTLHIARAWGLAASFDRRETASTDGATDFSSATTEPPAGPGEFGRIQSVIENALRSAGLMR